MIPKGGLTSRDVNRVLLVRAAATKVVRTVLLFKTFPFRSGVRETVEQMLTDLRQLARVAYVRMFVYTVVASFVLLYGTIFVYDELLDPAVSLLTNGAYSLIGDAPIEVELMLFGIAALVPIVNCARVLFLARISGKDPVERFSLSSLFQGEGVELALLIVLVPFLSNQLFEATGLQNTLKNLTELANAMTIGGGLEPAEVQRVAVTVSVLYLYPSIILVYLSHSKLTRLYPFTQFIAIARTWSYSLLILTILPVVFVLNLYLTPIIGTLSDPDVTELWAVLFEPAVSAILIVLTALTFQFVFLRLGSIAVSDRTITPIFTGEIDKEIQLTLSDFH